MIKIEKNSTLSSIEVENDEILTAQIMQAFADIKDSLFEELKVSAELQVKSEASAMAMSCDSIY